MGNIWSITPKRLTILVVIDHQPIAGDEAFLGVGLTYRGKPLRSRGHMTPLLSGCNNLRQTRL